MVQQVPAVEMELSKSEDLDWDKPPPSPGVPSSLTMRQAMPGRLMGNIPELEGPRAVTRSTRSGRSHGRFEALDTLRGIAALGVSALHLERGEYFLQNWNGVYAPALYLGLDFFLVLSGFVLSHGYMFADDPVTPLKFVRRRLVRLWPLHALAVATTALARHACGIMPLAPVSGVVLDFAQELALLQCVGLPYPHVAYNNMLSWTVSCELWINVVFAFCSCQGTYSIVAVVLLGLALQVWLFFQVGCLDVWSQMAGGFINIGLVRCSSCFMLGVAAYAVHKGVAGYKLKVWIATLAEFASVVAVVALVSIRPTNCYATDFAAAPLFVVVVLIFAWERGWLSYGLSYLCFLGKVSYSVYLNQWTVLFCLKANGVFDLEWLQQSVLLQLALYWSILLPYSCITYFVVERPMELWWKGRLQQWFPSSKTLLSGTSRT